MAQGNEEHAAPPSAGPRAASAHWSSKSLAGKWRHRFFYLLIRLFGVRVAKVPLFFVVCFYVLRPAVSRRAAHYLTRRFMGGAGGRTGLLRHTFRLYWSFGCILVERAAAGILGKYSISSGRDCLDQMARLLARGRGLIILSAHVGSWQTALAGLQFGARVNILQPRDGQDIDLHVFEHGVDTAEAADNSEISWGADAGAVTAPCRIIDQSSGFGGLIESHAALRAGEILCIMGDRLMPDEKLAVEAPFLGGIARFPGSAYLLASMSGAPVAVVFSCRAGAGRTECSCCASFTVPRKIGKNAAAVRPYAKIFILALEDYCRKEPYQFFNFHNIWKTEDDNDA